jgi:hypothetical protein
MPVGRGEGSLQRQISILNITYCQVSMERMMDAGLDLRQSCAN